MSPSLAQIYCCLSREPQSLWIRLNVTELDVSADENNLTGMDTMPKEIEAEAIGRIENTAVVFWGNQINCKQSNTQAWEEFTPDRKTS